MDLEARLDRVESTLAIQQLKARYAAVVDARYVRGGPAPPDVLDALASQAAALFVPDGTWDGGPVLGRAEGRDAITERLRRPTLRFARHLFTSPVIEVEGDQATGRWELISPITSDDGKHQWMAGVEHDTYRRLDGQWLHASMRLEVTFVAPITDGWDRILH